MFDFLQICLRKAKPVCKIPHMFILADVWLLPNMFGKNQTRWYIYTWVLFSTHVWILTHRYGKRHTCVKKATQLYVCKCLAFSTHVWEKPLTCLFPPELWVPWDGWTIVERELDDEAVPRIIPCKVKKTIGLTLSRSADRWRWPRWSLITPWQIGWNKGGQDHLSEIT